MNPRSIWQSQKMDSPIMTAQEIREKVGKLRTKARREMVFNLAVAGVGSLHFLIVFVLFVRGVYGQISWGLVIAGLFYMLGYLIYESVQRKRDERINSCLKFYRRALERKRQHLHHMVVAAVMLVAGSIMVVLPGVALILQYPAGNIWIKLAPFWIILGLWGLLYYLMRRRIRDEFRREFATLERLEKEFGE